MSGRKFFLLACDRIVALDPEMRDDPPPTPVAVESWSDEEFKRTLIEAIHVWSGFLSPRLADHERREKTRREVLRYLATAYIETFAGVPS